MPHINDILKEFEKLGEKIEEDIIFNNGRDIDIEEIKQFIRHAIAKSFEATMPEEREPMEQSLYQNSGYGIDVFSYNAALFKLRHNQESYLNIKKQNNEK